jgi:hypothetical protein
MSVTPATHQALADLAMRAIDDGTWKVDTMASAIPRR